MKHRLPALFVTLLAVLTATLACRAQAQLPEGVTKLEIAVDGVTRTGFVYEPPTAKESPAPVVFVWHGHGGTAMAAGRSFAMHKHWPEAISVYLQGLNTPGKLTDPEGKKPGWQHGAGAEGDRDLKLFDAVLAHLKEKFKVDAKRLFRPGTRMAADSPTCCGRHGLRFFVQWLPRHQRQRGWLSGCSSQNHACTSLERRIR